MTEPFVPPPSAKESRQWLLLLAGLLLATWVWYWARSFYFFVFQFYAPTWFPRWSHLGLDFWGTYLATKHWVGGGNPYTETFGDWRGKYAYPPTTMVLFAWTAPLSQFAATLCWFLLSTSFVTLGVAYAHRLRARLSAFQPPMLLLLALMLLSTPMLFAHERGTIDTWCIPLLILAMLLWKRKDLLGDAGIGLLFAIAAWIKIYPGALLVGLIPLRRWRAFAIGVGFTVLIGVVPKEATLGFFHNTVSAQHDRSADLADAVNWLKRPSFSTTPPIAPVEPYGHSITTYWRSMMSNTFLGTVPGLLAAAMIVGSFVVLVSLRMWHVTDRIEIVWPYLLWLLAAATFVLPYAFDYNLFFLVLAILVIWDPDDHWRAHIPLLFFMLWWQPFRLEMGEMGLLVLKFAGLVACAISLINKTRLPARVPLPDVHAAPAAGNLP